LINFDQLFARQPYTSLTGTEIVAVQGSSGTGGAVMNTLKAFFKSGFVANDVTDAGVTGKQVMQTANLAAAKTLLEIPALPLAPATLSANTTLGATHINRRVFVTSAVTLTLDAAALTTTDTLYIVNTSGGSVTLNAGSGEDMILWGGSGTVTTYAIPSNYCVKAYRVDSNTWFIEY
jgi:hypothetical protein